MSSMLAEGCLSVWGKECCICSRLFYKHESLSVSWGRGAFALADDERRVEPHPLLWAERRHVWRADVAGGEMAALA